jgi:hypothetical protein
MWHEAQSMDRCAPSSVKPVEKWSKFDWKADCANTDKGKARNRNAVIENGALVIEAL